MLASVTNAVHRTESPEGERTGLSFTDLLFALAAGEYLLVVDQRTLTVVDWFHLAVGAVLTLTSWVGFHNSGFRSGQQLRFWNPALGMWVLDVAMVIDYWVLPSKFIGSSIGASHRHPSATPVAIVVAIAFLLYAAWDWVGTQIPDVRASEGREGAQRIRVGVSYLAATAAVIFASIVALRHPHSRGWVIAVDVFLILGLVAYRTVKESARRRNTPNVVGG